MKTIITKIGVGTAASAMLVTGIGVGSAQAASFPHACVTQLSVAHTGIVQAVHDVGVAKVLKGQLTANHKKRVNQNQQINFSKLIPQKLKKLARRATAAEYGAIAAWYRADASADLYTSLLIVDHARKGNAATCGDQTKQDTATAAIATADTNVVTNLAAFNSGAANLVPVYLGTLAAAFDRFNQSTIGIKAMKKLVADIKKATVGLALQTVGLPITMKKSDDDATAALVATLATVG